MPPPLNLKSPLDSLRGIGSERVTQLARLHLHSIEDLFCHRPRRYEDRRQAIAIADLELGQAATVHGKVVAKGLQRFRRSRKTLFEVILDDGAARLHCRWWNLPFMDNYFQQGDEVFAYGKPNKLKPRTMDHPETEVIVPGEDSSIHLNRITPIYPLTEGLPQRWVRAFLWRLLQSSSDLLTEPHPTLDLGDLPSRKDAFNLIHFPHEFCEIERARQRLALDEYIDFQGELNKRRQNLRNHARALPCRGTNEKIKPFLAKLGYQLTEAQTRVLREIRGDMGGESPMRRLIQGDVGSGKTVVAACSALMAMENGYNAVLMAPTEILAEQHFSTFQRWFQPLALSVELHTGSRKTRAGKGRDSPDQNLLDLNQTKDQPCLVIGTHALVQESFTLPKVGLVIIDEQHKFGVTQRENLLRKGNYPHLLVMTATPIPRTLGLTLYGDLDMSVIDEMPTGRGQLKTYLRSPDAMQKVFVFIKKELQAGRQAYVVYPRVDETGPSTSGPLKAVTQEFERLKKVFPEQQVGLLHGRLPSETKEKVMAAFRSGALHILVATSVIEVGLDVPNATVMLIENANQFGLAQLHQLRGRIGRGHHDAYCILVANEKTEEARKRLQIMVETHDGFQIAEADLEQRGPGEFLGQQQSGLPPFKFGNLVRDKDLIQLAKTLVTS